jgi:hypothetical protein
MSVLPPGADIVSETDHVGDNQQQTNAGGCSYFAKCPLQNRRFSSIFVFLWPFSAYRYTF